MKLTVLGRYGPYPAANGACSGYLLQEDSCSVLLECGNGVLSRLQNYMFPWELDGIIVSHLHGDHISDLFIMRYALDIAQNRGVTDKSLNVYLPDEPAGEVSRISFKEAFTLHYLHDESQFSVGPFNFSFFPVQHPLPTLAVRVECKGKVLAYSGDTEYFPGIESMAQDADLFLCEANFQQEEIEASMGNHLSAAQAAQIASRGGVKKLLLTHLPAFKDLEVSREEAQKFCPGAELAEEELSLEI